MSVIRSNPPPATGLTARAWQKSARKALDFTVESRTGQKCFAFQTVNAAWFGVPLDVVALAASLGDPF